MVYLYVNFFVYLLCTQKIFSSVFNRRIIFKFSRMSIDIKTYRLLKGLSQEALAKQLNLAKSTISMVENNERKLPSEARALFESLVAMEPVMINAREVKVPFGLEEVRANNFAMGETALLQLEKECEFELLKAERNLRNWKKRYETARVSFMQADDLLTKMEKDNTEDQMPPGYATRQQMAKVKALQTLTLIGGQKPVLTIVKITGLEQQLRTIRQLLKKPVEEKGDDGMWLKGG